MTTVDGKCCGNCDAFMPDRFNWGEQGACAVIDDECIAYGMYRWTTEDGDCEAWENRKKRDKRAQPRMNPKTERELYEKRMRGDWS